MYENESPSANGKSGNRERTQGQRTTGVTVLLKQLSQERKRVNVVNQKKTKEMKKRSIELRWFNVGCGAHTAKFRILWSLIRCCRQSVLSLSSCKKSVCSPSLSPNVEGPRPHLQRAKHRNPKNFRSWKIPRHTLELALRLKTGVVLGPPKTAI